MTQYFEINLVFLIIFLTNFFYCFAHICQFKDCDCENDSGFDYVTCIFYSNYTKIEKKKDNSYKTKNLI